MKNKILSSVIVALMIAVTSSFSAFATLANGTVVIGNKPFDLNYANNAANLTEITNAIVEGGTIYVKDFSGNWIENTTGNTVDASMVPGENPSTTPTEPIIILKATINSSLPEYTFKVYGQKSDTIYSANKIAIYNGSVAKEKLQELIFDNTSTPDGSTLGLIIEDMNFDGYKDIRIQQSIPASANIPYYYWLWDKKTSKFVKNIDLEKISSPVFDIQSQSIKSNVRENAATYYDNEYKYINNNPTLIKETKRIADPQKNVWHITVTELVDNIMKITKEYDETI